MRILLLAVGRARGDVADAIAEYEKRAGRNFSFEAVEVKEEQYRGKRGTWRVREEEGNRLLARVPAGAEIVALHETGKQ